MGQDQEGAWLQLLGWRRKGKRNLGFGSFLENPPHPCLARIPNAACSTNIPCPGWMAAQPLPALLRFVYPAQHDKNSSVIQESQVQSKQLPTTLTLQCQELGMPRAEKTNLGWGMVAMDGDCDCSGDWREHAPVLCSHWPLLQEGFCLSCS